MKETLLELYEKFIVIDPEYTEDRYRKHLQTLSDIASKVPDNSPFKTLKRLLSEQATSLSHYYAYRDHTYWKSVSGKKVLTNGNDIFTSLDPWWPSENSLFEITRGSVVRVAVLLLLKEKYQCQLQDLPTYYKGTDDIISTIVPDLEKLIVGQELYCFYMGNPRNGIRKKPIKVRKAKVTSIKLENRYYYSYLRATLEDKTNKQTIYANYTDGWNFYLTKELLESRLNDIGNFWMQDWDKKVGVLEREIQALEKQVSTKKQELKTYQSSVADYNKSIKNILWKDYSIL